MVDGAGDPDIVLLECVVAFFQLCEVSEVQCDVVQSDSILLRALVTAVDF